MAFLVNCIPYTVDGFSFWALFPPFSSSYPIAFLLLGISSILTLFIPKTFHLFGYFFHFYPLCTQNISLTLSIPKTFHLFGYFLHFSLLCTQNISSFWVFPSLPLLCTQSYFSLGYTDCFLLLIPQMPCSMCIQWHTIVQLSGSPTQEESCSSGFSACGGSLQRHNTTPPQCAPVRRALCIIGKSTEFPI